MTSKSNSIRRVEPPAHYPTKCADGLPQPLKGETTNETYISPILQLFKFLIATVMFMVYNASASVWNKGMMDAYLLKKYYLILDDVQIVIYINLRLF